MVKFFIMLFRSMVEARRIIRRFNPDLAIGVGGYASGPILRAAIARFWREPYRAPLVRWGTELHDRFMLPHFVWQDFEDVMLDMQDHGYPLQADWFAPHFEFRFPTIGQMSHRGIHFELRTALEPWHVLGEVASGGGAVR